MDEALGINQEFEYDNLNRVVSAQTGGNRLYLKPMQYEYDANGNILYKSDVGAYEYNNPDHIHAVTRAGNRHFAYDANGNMVDDNGMKISYDRFNKPVTIRTNGTSVEFAYDPEGDRYRKSTGRYEIHYLGKSYEHIRYNDGREQDRYYIYADGKVQAIHTNGSNDTFETRYLHYDALGSVDTVTDMNGFAIQRAVYKPFGEKIVVDNEGNRVTTPAYTHRGYTGHEEIEETDNLIHMNGRVYDSKIARFISADPHIQAPQDTQSYNRYSYVKNNPLKYTDPSGYFFSGLKKWVSRHWKSIVTTVATVAAGVLTGGVGLGLGVVAQGAAIGFTAGAAGTLVNGGSVGSALRNGMIGGVFGAVGAGFANGIGNIFGHGSSFLNPGINGIGRAAMKAAAHGIVRGIMQASRGGKFGAGFAAGFISSGFSVGTSGFGGVEGRTAIMAVVGGTVSQITGGKFANGAWGSAFQYMFNDMMTKAEINTHNQNVMRNEQMRNIYRQNAALAAGELRTGIIGGLQRINLYSSLLSAATAVDGDYVYSAFFTGASIASEGLLYLSGYENASVVYQHSYIDAVFTPLMLKYPAVGTTADFITKTISDQ